MTVCQLAVKSESVCSFLRHKGAGFMIWNFWGPGGGGLTWGGGGGEGGSLVGGGGYASCHVGVH